MRKSGKDENFMDKVQKGRHMSMFFLIIIILVAFLLIVLGLRSINVIKLPSFIEQLFVGDTDVPAVIPGDDGRIYKALAGAKEGTAGSVIVERDISRENLMNMLTALTQPAVLYIEATAEYFDIGSSRAIKLIIQKKGAKYSYKTIENSVPQSQYINNTVNEYFEDYILNKSRTGPAPDSFDYSSMPFMPDVPSYFALLGDSMVISDYSVARTETDNILMLTFDMPELRQREELYISLDLGIVTYIRTFDSDGRLLYQYRADSYKYSFDPNDTSRLNISDSVFEIR